VPYYKKDLLIGDPFSLGLFYAFFIVVAIRVSASLSKVRRFVGTRVAAKVVARLHITG